MSRAITIREFVQTEYPIKPIIERIKADPVKSVMEKDDLPYDSILYVDGQLQKVVYMSDDDYVTVVDLLSYLPEEVSKSDNKEFRDAYFAYIDNISIEDVNIANIMNAASELRKSSDKRSNLLGKFYE